MHQGSTHQRSMHQGVGQREIPIVIPRLVDPADVSPDERDEHLMLLEAAREALEVEWTATLAAADTASDHTLWGYPSTVAYLKHRMSMAGSRAHRSVKRARAASAFPATMAAWRHRQINGDEAEILFWASERIPEYARGEQVLLEMVGDGPDDTKRLIDSWRAGVERRGLTVEEQRDRRRMDVTRRANGMVTGEFALPQLEGETLLTALDALMPPVAEADGRTTTQRRADALGDLARAYLDHGDTPVVGGQRPHLTVHVDLPALLGRPGGLHETAGRVVVDPVLVDQLSCDACVSRVVFGPGSEVLDVGRRTRVVPAGLRRAVVARDRHCSAPGCTRPDTWCDVHHIVPWADGGETEIGNLTLLCRFHHTRIHLDMLDLDDLEPASGRSP